jgi:ribosomal protein L31E
MKEKIVKFKLKSKEAPVTRRTRKALTEIKEVAKKHTRIETKNMKITKELNEKLWERGLGNIPNKIEMKIAYDKEKAIIGLPEEKLIIDEKKKTKEKNAKETKTKEETKEKTEQEKEEEEKLKNKQAKEKTAEKLEMKKGKK